MLLDLGPKEREDNEDRAADSHTIVWFEEHLTLANMEPFSQSPLSEESCAVAWQGSCA